MKYVSIAVLMVGLAGVGARAYYGNRGAAPQVATSPVTRGDIVQVVSATGTVEALTTATASGTRPAVNNPLLGGGGGPPGPRPM